jgi:ribonuclease P protein component
MGSAPEMLRSRRDFAALQRASKSKVHPLFTVRFAPNGLGRTRFGLSTSRRVGNAVVRNRVRRRLREALRRLAPRVAPGWDILVICRPESAAAAQTQLAAALESTLERAPGILLPAAPDGPGA